MSCHDIGRGMNEVVRMTISLLDKGEIGKDSAKKIIATCRAAVYWCDGNEEEASLYYSYCRCGRCMSMLPEGELLLPLWPHENLVGFKFNSIEKKEHLISLRVCEPCFEELIKKYGNKENIENIKKKIIEYESSGFERYRSVGSYANDNNGFRWVRGTDWFD